MYRRQIHGWMKHLDFLLIDAVCLEMALLLSYVIKIQEDPIHGMIIRMYYSRLAWLLILFDFCIAFFFEAYTGILRRNKEQELQASLTHFTLVFLVVILYVWLTKQVIYSRQILLVFWAFACVLGYFSRCAWKRVVRHYMIYGKKFSKLVIITTNREAEECVSNFDQDLYKDFEVSGVIILDADRRGEKIHGVPVLASASDCMEYMRTNVVDEVFIKCDSREGSEAMADELLELGLTVHFSLLPRSALRPNKVVRECGNYTVLTTSMKIASTRQIVIKRAMDICGSIVGLLFTGIAFLIFAPIIKKQSPGPIFYAQTRIGKNGRRFKFYKFRTMVVGADAMKKDLMEKNEMDGLMFKMKDDPRIFGIGKFMRKYSIDELPQFWNVLKGDMSLVGTRPPTEGEYEQYELHHKARLGIKPGLTGMWQISGRSDIHDFEEIVELDTYYISNWSLWMDVRILLKTVLVVLTGKGSS